MSSLREEQQLLKQRRQSGRQRSVAWAGQLPRQIASAPLTIFDVATRQSIGTRATDNDRTNTCQALDTALSEGQLSMEEHRQRVSAATNAATLGDLQSLVSDLQTHNAPVQLPKLKSANPLSAGGGWGIRIAMAVVLVLLGVGIGWGVFGSSSPLSSRSDPGAQPDGIVANLSAPPRLLHSAGGLNGLLEQMRKKFGDTMGYGLTIYPDYASLERPDPGDDRRKVSYYYRGGFEGSSGSPSGTSSDDRLVDLGKFDVAAIVGKLRGAPQILGIEQKDVKSTYVSIDPSKDATTPNAVDISIYVSTTYDKGGYLRVDPQGNVIGQYPPS
jgi:Domain of unknown function (DUF1707)